MNNPQEPLPPSQAPIAFRAAFKRIDKRMDRMEIRDDAIENELGNVEDELKNVKKELKEIQEKLKRWGGIIIVVATIFGSAIGGNVSDIISNAVKGM